MQRSLPPGNSWPTVQDACCPLQLIEQPGQPPFGADVGALQEVFLVGGCGMTGMPMPMGNTAIPGAVGAAAALLLFLEAAYAFAPWLMHWMYASDPGTSPKLWHF
jgi:hypothetical protein